MHASAVRSGHRAELPAAASAHPRRMLALRPGSVALARHSAQGATLRLVVSQQLER